MTTLKPRKITTTTVDIHKSVVVEDDQDDITVEQYLEKFFEDVVKDFKLHTAGLISKLHQEYEEGAQSINEHMSQSATASAENKMCVILKCVAGSHIGQKFRLESTDSDDDIFKMGRSTGRLFKEKGVSLYKDKEISTTHAKIELRNGPVFLIDCKSTNGTLLNNEEIAAEVPLRLKDSDKITMGSTELLVIIDETNNRVDPNTGEQETY